MGNLSYIYFKKNFSLICTGIELQKTGDLYLSSFVPANNPKLLQSNKIKFVLSVFQRKLLTPRYSKSYEIQHKIIEIVDTPSYNISQHFDETYELIDKNLQISSVLVHCVQGKSRSASIVIAYLMKKFSWKYEQAFKFVKEKRGIVQPNQGFVEQLLSYQKKLNL